MALTAPERLKQVYSLWMIPDQPAFQFYDKVISRLSSQFGLPLFHPHLTLFGGLCGDKNTLADITKILGEKVMPLKISLSGLGYENVYYKSLYLEAEKTEALMNARKTAEEMLDSKTVGDFHPHLSLAYGLENTEYIIGEFNDSLFQQFEVNQLVLMSTKGAVKEWWEVVSCTGN